MAPECSPSCTLFCHVHTEPGFNLKAHISLFPSPTQSYPACLTCCSLLTWSWGSLGTWEVVLSHIQVCRGLWYTGASTGLGRYIFGVTRGSYCSGWYCRADTKGFSKEVSGFSQHNELVLFSKYSGHLALQMVSSECQLPLKIFEGVGTCTQVFQIFESLKNL